MTRLRQMMLEELERRNYSPRTIECYIPAVKEFARYFHRSPDQLGPQHIREYQAYLFRQRKLAPSSVTQRLAALRFFFIRTLKRPWSVAETPYPKKVQHLPSVLSQEEVSQLINAAPALLPIPGKGGSDWGYSWVPVVGPLIGGAIGAAAYVRLLG